jgi:hypothetical protein
VVDDEAMRLLLAQQERWLVERKRQAEIEDLAKEIASFANSDGGWVLVGVEDDGGPVAAPPEGATAKLFAAPQHWLGQKLGRWLDPIPAFEADIRQIHERDVVVIRVWRSTQAPIVHTGKGTVYERSAEAAVPISAQERLRELAARRDDAERDAGLRLSQPGALPALASRLGAPPRRPETSEALAVVVRLTPVGYVPEAFERVALGQAAIEEAFDELRELFVAFGRRAYTNFGDRVPRELDDSVLHPFQRGFAVALFQALDLGHGYHDRHSATYAADAGGVLGVRLARSVTTQETGGQDLDCRVVADEWLAPALRLLAARLTAHYVPGPVKADLWMLGCAGKRLVWHSPDAQDAVQTGTFGNGQRGWIQASADLQLADEAPDLLEVASRWTRDLAREAGITVFEGPSRLTG